MSRMTSGQPEVLLRRRDITAHSHYLRQKEESTVIASASLFGNCI